MSETEISPRKKTSADWLFRGVLTKIGDTVDRFTGRRWTPSSSLATSELIERIKKLLDAEARDIPGKGKVVPHLIKLKIQWDKFSTDSETLIDSLRDELLTATIDHINDSLYYTYAPVEMEVKVDYFVDGVKLLAGFDKFDADDREVEMNVTVPAMNLSAIVGDLEYMPSSVDIFTARFKIGEKDLETKLEFTANGRLSVGRTSENPLQINDGSISKIHATLAITPEGALSVADTGSTNGTFINGERIAYGKANLLEKDDVVKFGLIDVTFEHTQRAVIVAPAAEPVEDGEKMETVEIDGFEFKSRMSPDAPQETASEVTPAETEAAAGFEKTMNVAPAAAPVAQPAEPVTTEKVETLRPETVPAARTETASPQPPVETAAQIEIPETELDIKINAPLETQTQPENKTIDRPIPMPGAKE